MIGIGRDRGRRSITGAKVKDQRKQATRRRKGFPTGNAEEKYIGFRSGLSPSIWLEEVLDQQLKLHLRKEYRNEGETSNVKTYWIYRIHEKPNALGSDTRRHAKLV